VFQPNLGGVYGVKLLPVGTLLDHRYQIVSILGKGGSGAVYKACDLQNNHIVAVKVLTVTGIEPHATMQLQYFQREVGLLKRVSHPNIIHILDSGISDEKFPYLVTDYVDGQSLKAILKAGQLTLKRTANILSQVSHALQAIHDQGIIHRDFKPQNILITENQQKETAKLLDFGIAKMIRGDREESYLHTITSKGIVSGTLQYMSPEHCQGHKLDERTDIYSMGITAYEMVSGRLPFDISSTVGMIMLHVEATPPAIPAIPKAVESVIMKAIEKFPENRFARAIDFSEAFANAVTESKDFSESFVIKGDGASPNQETEEFIIDPSEAPTAQHESNDPNIWTTIKRKLKF
jgi:serine/threonine-protein kinase